MKRCAWVTEDQIYIDYHDQEWGIPSRDDQHLFEMLILEGAQAGLSWITVLKKRNHYKKLFHNFEIQKVANLTDKYLEKCLTDPGIIRNRLKVYATRKNAQATLRVIEEFGSLSKYLWDYVDNEPIINNFHNLSEIPANTPLSDKISKDLKKRGFTFVGSTIIYAYLQAVGIVCDHTTDCHLHPSNL